MRYVWIVLLALSLSTVVYGQKSAAVRQLEQQRKEALADIEETNKLLQETAQTAKTSLNRLNLLSKQILSRKKVISLLNQELDEIEKDILNIQGQLRTLKRELGDKQTNYGKSMRGLYKRHSSQDKLLFILSAESFSQSMRRMRYLREYADWQKRQANDIVEKQAEISRKQAEMEKTRAEKRALLGTRQEESKKLESEEASQKEEVQLLNKRQKDLKADLQKKRRQAEALNRQIEKQIAEEIARAEAEAKAARERAERERRGGGTGADLLAGRSGQAGGRCDMTTLATIRQAMTAFLAEAGIEALSAWHKEVWKGRKTPVAEVQVKEVEAGASGFQNYLGQTYDPAARQWTERYGRRITVKFGVTLYSPEAAGESGCQALLEQVAQALMERGPAGFAVEKWSAGETAFDQASGMFWGKLQAVCRGMLVAGMEESGELEGFTVRGEVTL